MSATPVSADLSVEIVGAVPENMRFPVDAHAIERERAVCACGTAMRMTSERTRTSTAIRIHERYLKFRTMSLLLSLVVVRDVDVDQRDVDRCDTGGCADERECALRVGDGEAVGQAVLRV